MSNLSGFNGTTPEVQRIKDEASLHDVDNTAELTGVMDYKKLTEVLMFVDRIYPRWLTKLSYSHLWGWFFKPLSLTTDDANVRKKLVELINSENHRLPDGAECDNFVALRRDGGAFVKFLVPPTSNPKDLVAAIEKNLRQAQAERKPLSNLKALFVSPPRALLVKGTPWIEDLSRFPSSQLKVIFEGAPLTEEELYSLFRRYGLIVDITPYSSSSGFAKVVFKSTDSCIRAKNCITGMTLNDDKTTLHLQYLPMQRVNHITAFISSHQRIVIPVILALLATIAVLIFEPIRQQFIEIKIKRWLTYKNSLLFKVFYVPYKYMVSSISDGRHFLDDSLESITGSQKHSVEVEDVESDMIWTERSERAKEVRFLLSENANTFIVIKGPKGSAEREFVMDHVLYPADTTNKILEIDCAQLIKARSDNMFLKAAAGQLGYFPLFTWTNSVSQFVDLGLQGLTGQKSGLSESKETQYKNMLLLTQAAIRKVSLAEFPSYKCEFEHQQTRKQAESASAGDSEYKVVELKEETYLQQHPEVKPVIVITNFMRKTDSPHDFVFKALADWAGQLIQNNLAHVIFITLDSGSSVHLTSALPNQVFKTISLDDASPRSAKQYVNRQLRNKYGDSIDTCLEPLGGRMLDLQAFVRRVKSGEEPANALKEMVHQALEQISTFFLNVATDSETPWDTAQLWKLIRLLADKDIIEISELVKVPLFSLDQETLNTLNVLEKNDVILLKRDKGIVKSVGTGRPLFKAAFKELVEDEKVFQIYETLMYNRLIALENAKIIKMEDQFSKLAPKEEAHVKERLEYLSSKLRASTMKVKSYDEKVKELAGGKATSKSSFFGF